MSEITDKHTQVADKSAEAKSPAGKRHEREFERLTLNQRIQHWVLIFSFTLLVITGMPILLKNWAGSEPLIRLMGGISMRAALHRFGALLLIGICAYHLLYVMFSKRGRDDLGEFMPGLKDAKDLLQMLKYYLGLSKAKPRFGRYNYIEKFEYFAMGWGSFVMIVTGLALWFENQAMIILPKWAMDVAYVVHGYEALLAFLAIVIWHLYHVHLNPESFPMSRVWLTGRITEHELRELHTLEYEKIVAEERQGEELGMGDAV